MRLVALYREMGRQWSRIAAVFQNRTDVNVKNRWVILQRREKRAPRPAPPNPPPQASTTEPATHKTDAKPLIQLWDESIWQFDPHHEAAAGFGLPRDWFL
jgi:hypothetical protein